jgi:hypothetical protein
MNHETVDVTYQQHELVGAELQAPFAMAEFNETLPLTADYVFPTTPLPIPPAIPDAHRATITSVEARHYENEKGTVALVVHLTSLDVPTLDTEYQIFVPKLFAENIKVDPTTLPDEVDNKQRTVYRMSIASEDGTAKLQKLRKLAADAGRTIDGVGIARPSANIDEYAENHSKLLMGLQVVFYRDADKRDENSEFANRLRVKGILSIEDVMLGKKERFLKKYKKMWLLEQ